jgi:hypothetical protein
VCGLAYPSRDPRLKLPQVRVGRFPGGARLDNSGAGRTLIRGAREIVARQAVSCAWVGGRMDRSERWWSWLLATVASTTVLGSRRRHGVLVMTGCAATSGRSLSIVCPAGGRCVSAGRQADRRGDPERWVYEPRRCGDMRGAGEQPWLPSGLMRIMAVCDMGGR